MAFWPKEIMNELVHLAAKGLTYGRIAQKMSLSRNAVIGKARRMGLRQPPKPEVVASPPQKIEYSLENMRLISIMDLAENDCRYPIESSDGFVFCGLPKARGAYCSYHAKKCYVPPKPIKKSADQSRGPYKHGQTFF